MLSPDKDLRTWDRHAVREALGSTQTAVAAVTGVTAVTDGEGKDQDLRDKDT